ncbi:MAG TPA: response regulator [Candidatus Omnitrophota bacterium]|nr:response regulator [Candidatus Omnitrophota bacterium]HQB93668.1 response regulator [Candidatus Omnitrophota bacterium]
MSGRKSILIVDDDVAFSNLARMVLTEKGGFEVVVCNKSETALTMIGNWRPDLILLDIVMPNMDGTEIAEQLRMTPDLSSIPVIFFTSLMTPEEAAAHPALSKNRFIPKPVKAGELLKQVREFFKIAS